MHEHLDDEALSGLLDTDGIETISSCPRCSGRYRAMLSASTILREIDPAPMTADEVRELRLGILAATARRPPARWIAAAAGSVAILVAVGLYISGPRPRNDGVGGPRTMELRAARLDIASEGDIRSIVEDDPQVKAGLGRYRVSDVGSEKGQVSEAQAPSNLYSDASIESIESCITKVRRSQSYPMISVLAREATFKSQPAYLLAYVWTSSTEDDAPLDRVQAWVVSPSQCATLTYVSFKPR
ncbi:MAG TPA: hypothetical protein VI541_00600 [Actinomycetota bacterium]|nr:hypothetical protein [Actinomycetota bacterium]